MKIKFALVLPIVCVSVLFSGQAFAYTDVPADHEFVYEIEYLESLGLLPMDINKFEPDREITPLDLYYFLLTYSETKLAEDIDLPYLDTNNTDWYATYIQTAINKGLLKPAIHNPTLAPNRKVRKREAIMKVFDTVGVGVNKLFDESYFPFTDLNSGSTSAPYMFRAYQIGILESSPTTAKASKKVTRGELAYYLYQIYEYETEDALDYYSINLDYTSATPEIDTPAFDIFVDIWDTIKDSYYYQDEVDEEEMMYSAINGLIETLDDPYTVFTSPFSASPLNQLETEYEGVGMSVEMIDNEVVIISPFKGSPAEAAGLEPNDVITEIDGQSVSGLSLDAVVDMIKGESGTTVKIKVRRGSTNKTITVTRGYITYSTVTLEYMENVAYVNVVSFSEDTTHEFLDVAQEIYDKQQTEGNVEGIILDLRNNPGGFLDVAIEITGFFFDEDVNVVMLEESDEDKTMYYAEYYGEESEYEYGAGLLSDYEVVVLVNEGSASASEIVAGALQDHDRAEILGETTFGKGTVQEVFFYNDESIFKLTVSKWLTPEGQDINHTGLTPDRVLTNSETTDWQLDTAIEEILY